MNAKPFDLALVAQEAADASSRRKWELEAHGGWTIAGHPTGGSQNLPTTGAIVGGLISASSLYFGEGARLCHVWTEEASMMVRWRPLALAGALNVTVVVGVATAQTVIVTKAPPGSTIELVLNAATIESATADPGGRAALAVNLSAHGGKTETDARIYVDVCRNLRRVLVVESAWQPPPLSEACVRREIAGVYVLRRVTTLVVEVTESGPAVRLRQGPVPTEWLGEEPEHLLGVAKAQGEQEKQEAAYASSRRKWELEAHGGWAIAGHPTGGSQNLPTTGAIVGGLISASSLYFGEGTRLFNQNQIAIAGSSVPTITALDPVVLGSVIRWRRSSETVGVRLDRAFGERISLEITADYNRSVLVFTDGALNAIEAARASFVRALARALANESIPSTVTSVTTVNERPVAQVFTSAALLVNLRKSGKAIPYVVGGGGTVFDVGNTPSASFVGNYQFGASSQVFGTDSVDLQYSVPDRDYVGIGGGGLKYYATPRWGVRVDGRAQISRNRIENLVSATPARALESTGSPFPIIVSGALQFSSTAPLTGAPLAGVTTFSGSGYQVQVSIAAGVFWRF